MKAMTLKQWWIVLILAAAVFVACGGGGNSEDQDASTDTDTDSDSDSDSDSNSDSDTDTDTDTDSDSDTDTDTDTDTEVDCWGSLDADTTGWMGANTGADSSYGPYLSLSWSGGDATVFLIFGITSWSDLGGPTTAGEYPVDAAMADQTGGLIVFASQIDVATSTIDLLYRPVEGTGSVTITEIPPIFDDPAVGQTFAGSVSFDMQQISTTTDLPVPDGCYLEGVQFDFEAVITAD